tara:strand:+ start:1554 stop:2759 length:1206 start_codon:yes stop_codon:yes gene_type:complete
MFYINEKDSLAKKYPQLLEDINNLNTIYSCKRFSKTYDFYVNLLAAIINNIDIIILDSNISDKEYDLLIGDNNLKNISYKNAQNKINISNFNKYLNTSSDVSLTLFTSGTTGTPKMVSHKFSSLIQSVKVGDYYKNNIWALAYNPTHIAGIQVFFQSVLNTNTIIDIFNTNRAFILNSLDKYKVTNLSATPTFYRLLLPFSGVLTSVKQVTVGGEKSDEKLINKLGKSFKNARITNIYASTEAGQILKSKGDYFKIENKLVKIVNNEILLHKSLLGGNDFSKSEWYETGDLIEYIDDGKTYFKIISRKNDLINSGGYMVNLIEVEEQVLEIEGISDVRVYAKKNAVIGSLIFCEVELLRNVILTEKDIKNDLITRLQPHKIPRIIKIVDSIGKTKTGKKIR